MSTSSARRFRAACTRCRRWFRAREILGVFRPGSHGSTYGGNPLACAVARAALRVIEDERLAERSAELGAWLLYELRKIRHPHIKEIRGRGLLIGIELLVPARPYCERLKDLGAALQGDARLRHPPGAAADHLAGRPGVGRRTGAQGVRAINSHGGKRKLRSSP